MKIMAKWIPALICLVGCAFGGSAGDRVIEFETPRLKVFLPSGDTANGKAVVACPGGGYTHLAVNHEGYDWTPYFNNLGVTYAVLEYNFPDGNRDIPLKEVEAAFKIMTDSATVWNINPEKIGIMGSSAGGHLASSVSTHATAGSKPAFQILFYPVISLDGSITHGGTRKGFLGESPEPELVEEWSNQNKVDAGTPRAFIALSSDDTVVNPENSILYYSALQKAGVPVSMFIWPTGGHGWGYHTRFEYHDNMLDELAAWLKSF